MRNFYLLIRSYMKKLDELNDSIDVFNAIVENMK